MQRRVVAGFATVLAAVLVLGTVDTLVWLPLHLAPGSDLPRIYRVLAADGDLPLVLGSVVSWLLTCASLTAAYAAVLLPVLPALRPATGAARAIGAAATGCLLLGGVGVSHWWSAFAMALCVSDLLAPYGGGTSPLGTVLALGGLGCGVIGAVLAVVAIRTRPKAGLRPVDNR